MIKYKIFLKSFKVYKTFNVIYLLIFVFYNVYADAPVLTGGNYKVMLDVFDIGGMSHTATSGGTTYKEYYCFGEAGGITRLTSNDNYYILQAGYYCQIFPPGSITDIFASTGTYGRTINLRWTSPGEEEYTGVITSGTYAIQYSTWLNTDSITWATGYAQVVFSTFSVSPVSLQFRRITSLIEGVTYYFRIWTKNTEGEWSNISLGATTWAQLAIISIVLIQPNTYYDFGSVGTNLEVVSSSGIVIRNNGRVLETYSLSVTTGTSPPANTVWDISTDATPGNNEFVLYAVFKSTQPQLNDFGDNPGNDILLLSNQTCSTTNFSANTPEEYDGVRVEPNVAKIELDNSLISDTTMWFKLKTPVGTTTIDQQRIIVTITAEESQ